MCLTRAQREIIEIFGIARNKCALVHFITIIFDTFASAILRSFLCDGWVLTVLDIFAAVIAALMQFHREENCKQTAVWRPNDENSVIKIQLISDFKIQLFFIYSSGSIQSFADKRRQTWRQQRRWRQRRRFDEWWRYTHHIVNQSICAQNYYIAKANGKWLQAK